MRDAQLKEMLTLSRWDQLDPSAQEEAAYTIAARLPELFRFDGLETHELGQQRHRVAFFKWKEDRFALIPGGPATLGYAPDSFFPTEAHLQSWEETCHEYPEMLLKSPTLEKYLENRLTPLRQVTFQPFLLETVATDLASLTIENGQQVYRFPSRRVSYPQTQEHIAKEGFQFPTSDEWEYACAAGARTLWRWGDDTPMIWMPTRKKSGEWDMHLSPNAFGLLIGDNPFNLEFTAEMGVFRGGDSGTALHVAPGRLIEWLTLASAYWYPFRVPKPEVSTAFLRRVYSLFQ